MQSESLSWKNRQISFKGDKKDGFFFVCHKCDAKFASTRVLKDHTCEQHSKLEDDDKTQNGKQNVRGGKKMLFPCLSMQTAHRLALFSLEYK